LWFNLGREEIVSRFSWLDFSEHDARQAQEVIDLFREEDTRDELGLGTIRDPIADRLFPGTSTIQTRARYFLFVPWVYTELLRRKTRAEDVEKTLRRLQGQLRDGLVGVEAGSGVIGARAGEDVRRLPSSVYWAGLRAWGIRKFAGSEADFHRRFERTWRREVESAVVDGGEGFAEDGGAWHRNLPAAPEGFPKEATGFGLSADEAEYLRERVMTGHASSLLAKALQRRQTIQAEEIFPWDVEWDLAPGSELNKALEHARDFSEVMHGASLLYNLMLSEKKGVEGRISEYEERLSEWRGMVSSRREELSGWDRTGFWEFVDRCPGARVPVPTQAFVEKWAEIVLTGRGGLQIARSKAARDLVTEREIKLKGARARLEDPKALERWGGEAGAGRLDFRWNRPVRAVVNDILEGLDSVGKGGRRGGGRA
jgi:Family of unknown function (DUF6361)